MRIAIVSTVFLAACTPGANHLGNALFLPVNGISSVFQNAAYAERRGAVEVQVKSNGPAILREIEAGGGPELGRAMDIAAVPPGDRPALMTQLRADYGLYSTNVEALITALMVYGG